MKSFSQFRATLKESAPTSTTPPHSVEAIDEETVHLKPHGNKGTHYKVVKGIKGHLEAGEVISDTHVDDLHDMGYKVKHLKENNDPVLTVEDVDALTDKQLDEMSVEDLEALEQQLSEEHDAAFLAEDKAKAKKVAKTAGRVEDAVTKKKGKPAPMHKG